ncbi:MAG TPA: threonine synthase, partial [Burkholderiaceae bacterium]|nr:threonine synthase [Burkholderiaceae bacterium]
WKIGTVNSINWARVVAQVVYYFKGYFAATKSNDEEVSFAVPSGNFGNVCAGHIARMMGLPIRRLICATNENDVLDEFFRTGVYRPRASAETYATSSPSMDISKASNFERFIADLAGRDAPRVAGLWRDVAAGKGFAIDAATMQRVASTEAGGYGFVSARSTHALRLATIRDVAERYRVVIDPHTADGVVAARQYLEPGVPMVVLETAQPAKFNETIVEALGHDAPRPPDFVGIEALPQRFEVVPAKVERVKAVIAERA